MDISKVTISCAKSDCPGGASLQQTRCSVCRDPVVKRYLKVIHPPAGLLQPGNLIGERYWVTDFPEIVLDTQPQEKPILTEEIPPEIERYLRLSPYLLHSPKVFGLLTTAGGWLLEYPSVTLTPDGLPQYSDLFASLVETWKGAEPLQQLNWLAQIATLLPEFVKQGAGGTFYDLSLLGINGGLVQVRELLLDQHSSIDFGKLGQVWKELLDTAEKSIRPFCQKLYQSLIQGKIHHPRVLQDVLEQGMLALGRSQYDYQYRLYTQTDPGPTRKHNEDACFPAVGKVHRDFPFAIVCDGIGGHDQGEVASAIAIETLQQQFTHFADISHQIDAATVQERINSAILQANDAICDRNDDERREDRKRMGTTLVLAWLRTPDLYLAHVGDSRIYRITPESCHQVTYDDDLGSREVRLGYALYQDALQYPAAGALVQALGMSSSLSLHPNLQRLIPDRDVVYLLCSDGLSDYGRVEGHWQGEIAPLIAGQRDLGDVGERLIQIANRENGHDNATVALLHIQVRWKQEGSPIHFPDLTQLQSQALPRTEPEAAVPVTAASTAIARRTPNLMFIGLLGIIFFGSSGWLFWQKWQRSQQKEPLVTPPPVERPTPTPSPSTPDPVLNPAPDQPDSAPLFKKDQIIRLQPDRSLMAYETAIANPTDTTVQQLEILGGSILRIEEIQGEQQQVKLQLCQKGTAKPTEKVLTEGNPAWVTMAAIKANYEPTFKADSAKICDVTATLDN